MKVLKRQSEWVLWLGFTIAMVLAVSTLAMFGLIGLK